MKAFPFSLFLHKSSVPVSDAVSGNCFSASSYPDIRQLRAESMQELDKIPAVTYWNIVPAVGRVMGAAMMLQSLGLPLKWVWFELGKGQN